MRVRTCVCVCVCVSVVLDLVHPENQSHHSTIKVGTFCLHSDLFLEGLKVGGCVEVRVRGQGSLWPHPPLKL